MNPFFNDMSDETEGNFVEMEEEAWRYAVKKRSSSKNHQNHQNHQKDQKHQNHQNDQNHQIIKTQPTQQSVPKPVHTNPTGAGDNWNAHLLRTLPPAHPAQVQIPNTSPNLQSTIRRIATHDHDHYAFIPTAVGLKAVMTRKRRRTAFNTEQVAILEEVFRGRPYVIREERSRLGKKLGISEDAIKVWFQNRRLKEKKEREELELELLQEYTRNNPFPHTEALLQHPDQNGFVTLNQESIDELVNAIDACLPKNLDLTKLSSSLGMTVDPQHSSPRVSIPPQGSPLMSSILKNGLIYQ
ncbi:homeobox protein Nkx-3.1-like [Ostrinia furnacalis]|uniref:homeobox protein Nkx-3.1-like n=1 Tax=Ostrinia furnacalis TaxID=93504 RepID=UPI00103997C7|nr:homeobox protein Nkx-3.1-like [Ostrinia furnacalis]